MTAANDFSALEHRLAELLATLSPAARRALARTIAKRLRASQQKRIAAQQNPHGGRYALRKPRKGLRKKAMFNRLRRATFLKTLATDAGAALFFNARAARIARVHHFGLRDRAEKNAPLVEYEQRELLGFTAADYAMVEEVILLAIGESVG